jgi:DNA-binding NarL/FixJ family response regulator
MGSQFLSKQDLGDATILDQALHAAIDLDNAPAPPRRQVPLSDSQLEIMRLVATGLTNDEIAERLWLTESGVKRAITRLLRKLELDGGNPRVQLTRAYYQLTGRAAGDE